MKKKVNRSMILTQKLESISKKIFERYKKKLSSNILEINQEYMHFMMKKNFIMWVVLLI